MNLILLKKGRRIGINVPGIFIVFVIDSTSHESGVSNCRASHLEVYSFVLTLLNEKIIPEGELNSLHEDQRCVVKEELKFTIGYCKCGDSGYIALQTAESI